MKRMNRYQKNREEVEKAAEEVLEAFREVKRACGMPEDDDDEEGM